MGLEIRWFFSKTFHILAYWYMKSWRNREQELSGFSRGLTNKQRDLPFNLLIYLIPLNIRRLINVEFDKVSEENDSLDGNA